jgi:hypothetical protein
MGCSATATYVDGDIRDGPFWAYSACGMAEFEHITLFLFALMCPHCCIGYGRALVYQVYNHMITSDWPYLPAVL